MKIIIKSKELVKFLPISLFLTTSFLNFPIDRASAVSINETVDCEILIVGSGLAGAATAYEALSAGRTVCMTEITDWVGGQMTSQGTSALDEAKKQRDLLFYSRGYNEFRKEIEKLYGRLNPGDCWVSVSCFLPKDGQKIVAKQLEKASKKGKGTLKWFPNTVIKDLELSADGKIIESAIAIQHSAKPNQPSLNSKPLSTIFEDIYTYTDSSELAKKVIKFVPSKKAAQGADWYVIEATETGEIVALADVPYRLGLDPVSYLNPSSPVTENDPYCTQGFTYTFAVQQTEEPQEQTKPDFYEQYQPYYGYDENGKFNFDSVFTYRRILAPKAQKREKVPPYDVVKPAPGDISMQNWVWGNDYRPGTKDDNFIYSRTQLETSGQLQPGGWQGGLRTSALQKGEEIALSFYYWLVEGTTDSFLEGVKKPNPNHRLVTGLDSPMGTLHGLSKYPYIREARRIIGRPSFGYQNGFSIAEVDVSGKDFTDSYYKEKLSPEMYKQLWTAIAGLESLDLMTGNKSVEQITRRSRSTIYPDSVGIAQYAIDFHPCMTLSPPETPGNTERAGVRQGHGNAYPGQIPLRAMIPQKIDNLLVAGKTMAGSTIAAAAYRVHSFEWSIGAAAGTTAAYALDKGIFPYQLVDDLPRSEPQLQELRQILAANNNPTMFPDTSIFNLNWSEWKPW